MKYIKLFEQWDDFDVDEFFGKDKEFPFEIGEEVVCIDDENAYNFLRKGEKYTITSIEKSPIEGRFLINITGIPRNVAFSTVRFKKVN